MSVYVGTALTFVAGMAWNDAVKSTIDTYVHKDSDSIKGKFLYAVTITIISIIIIYLLNNMATTFIQVLPDEMIKIIESPKKNRN